MIVRGHQPASSNGSDRFTRSLSAEALKEYLIEVKRAVGLTHLHLKILGVIWYGGAITVSDIADRASCTNPNARKYIKELVDEGYLEKTSRGGTNRFVYSIADTKKLYELVDLKTEVYLGDELCQDQSISKTV